MCYQDVTQFIILIQEPEYKVPKFLNQDLRISFYDFFENFADF